MVAMENQGIPVLTVVAKELLKKLVDCEIMDLLSKTARNSRGKKRASDADKRVDTLEVKLFNAKV